MMKNCSKLNTCYKVKMVIDKDLSFDWLYAEMIKQVCAECKEAVGVLVGGNIRLLPEVI